VRYVSVTFFDDVPDADCDGELEHAARSSTLAAAAAARHRRYIVGLSGGAQMEASEGHLPGGDSRDNVISGVTVRFPDSVSSAYLVTKESLGRGRAAPLDFRKESECLVRAR
jgi:hypothetical protein